MARTISCFLEALFFLFFFAIPNRFASSNYYYQLQEFFFFKRLDIDVVELIDKERYMLLFSENCNFHEQF